VTIDNFDLSAWTQEQRDLWLGRARKGGTAEHVPIPANEAVRANQAASVAGPYLPRVSSEWERRRIADETARGLHRGNKWDGKVWRAPDGTALRSRDHLPEPRAGYDPAKYDPAHPRYDYEPETYDPADYEEWKQARVAYQLKHHPNRSNPFGPESSAAVRIKPHIARRIITAAYNGIVQFFRMPQR